MAWFLRMYGKYVRQADPVAAGIWMLQKYVVYESELSYSEHRGMLLLEHQGLVRPDIGPSKVLHWHMVVSPQVLQQWVEQKAERLGIDLSDYPVTPMDYSLAKLRAWSDLPPQP